MAGRASFSALGIILLAGFATEASGAVEINELSPGEALYFAYQGKWFEALEQLDTQARKGGGVTGPTRDLLWSQKIDAEFALGDFELNYRMHQRAVRAIQAVLNESGDEQSRNGAAYRLARMQFRKGRLQDALRALDRISGKVDADTQDDIAFLRASVYLAQEWSEPAIPLLENLLGSKEYGAFAAYNLGIAYLQGDLRTAAYKQLDRAGKIKARDASEAAIRDKANLVLGTILHEEGQYRRAVIYLDRVRLEGPFSNRALLGAGWASMSAGKPDRAMVSWSALAKRDATDRATQEAMLALPYAYSDLGIHTQAVIHYSRALDAFNEQIGKLNNSIDNIRAGNFLAALTRDEIRENYDWALRLRSLPDTPETYYLMELLASNDFQTGLQNYLDLADLKRRVSGWMASLQAYDELVAARASHYEPLLPETDEQFLELDSRLRKGLEQQERLLQQRDMMISTSALQTTHQADLAELDRSLQSLDDALHQAQTQYDQFVRARRAAADSFGGYGPVLSVLPTQVRDSVDKIDKLMARQGRLLETLAANELTARLGRLEVYADKARFGLADSYDRAKQETLE